MVISNVKFFNGGGVNWSEIPERGKLEYLDKNLLFSQKPACASQIVSHTTYVETNNNRPFFKNNTRKQSLTGTKAPVPGEHW